MTPPKTPKKDAATVAVNFEATDVDKFIDKLETAIEVASEMDEALSKLRETVMRTDAELDELLAKFDRMRST